ncbi:winged helix-turn-helix transcriptional regulator [Sphingosinicella sp.]|uniref:winged helix-turn-helix transcriptional regulator n=1 Tax=Sphingosinicella sp. TaxID=1917971 RepID=UPI0035AE082D
MAQTTYGQFCPVAMAAEILCTRWTVVLLRELIAGSTRFNDLRRGLPRMSPALLSQRLKELEAAGIIHRQPFARDAGVSEYRLTEAGRELEPLVEAFGLWGHRWVDSELSLQRLDAPLLMWDMRRNLDPRPLPEQRTVVQFRYPELPADRRAWWLMIEPGAEIDLCSVDPGFDVDLYVSTDLRTMTAIWMGHDTVAAAVEEDRLHLTGDRRLTANMHIWLGLSPFAKLGAEQPSGYDPAASARM